MTHAPRSRQGSHSPYSRGQAMTRPPQPPDREVVRQAATARIAEIARHAWPRDTVIRRAGNTLRFGTRGARVVHLAGRLAGRYADWEAGHHGDVFDLWARAVLGLSGAAADFPAVLRDLAGFLGTTAGRPDAQFKTRPSSRNGPETGRHAITSAKQRADARAIARMRAAARPLRGSVAMGYLTARGLGAIPETPDLAFLPGQAVKRRSLEGLFEAAGASPPPWIELPAILCLARNHAGEITGLQRILLDANGRTRAGVAVPKPSTGRLAGAALHLPAAGQDADEGPLLLAEGPETALSLRLATGHETRAALGGFSSDLPVGPPGRTLILCHDADPPGSPAETTRQAFLDALRATGHDARTATPPEPARPGWDFNDVLVTPGLGAAAIRTAVRAALCCSINMDGLTG